MTNQLLLPALLPAQPPPPTPACDCDGFCSGHCSLPTAAGPPSTLTLYRLTPTNITDLVNKDTGNAEGDAFFTLDEYDLPMRCAQGVSTNSRGCFLDVSSREPSRLCCRAAALLWPAAATCPACSLLAFKYRMLT